MEQSTELIMSQPHDTLCRLCLAEQDQCMDEDCTETDHHTVAEEPYCTSCQADEEYKLKTQWSEAALALEELLTWAKEMGGFESKVWSRAAKLHELMTGRRIDV